MSVVEMLDPAPVDRKLCEHAPAVATEPRSSVCEECGSTFNLRSCTTCGHVGCCESQAGHARAHALGEQHPVIEQITTRGPGFAWCYDEKSYVRWTRAERPA
jgi:uncharacterized UBP type Zn finger protein